MNEYQKIAVICRNVPLSRNVSGRKRYPFKTMRIGDFFTVLNPKDAQRARSAVQSFCKRTVGRNFEVKSTGFSEWTCRRIN